MHSDELRQPCLRLLETGREREDGFTTREVAEALDISVYQARLLLLALQEDGLTRQLPGRKPVRGAALQWRIA